MSENGEVPGLCLVGFGEVASNWARTLLEDGYIRELLQACYLPRRPERLRRAQEKASGLGVRLVTSPAEVARDTAYFFNATTAEAAAAVLEAFLPTLHEGQTWVDLNAAAPVLKEQMAESAAGRGAGFIDGAIMSEAWKHGHRAALFVSGSGVDRFVEWAKPWNMNVVSVGYRAGQASRVKSCRSIIMKGMASSIVEGMLVAEMFGVREAVLQSAKMDMGTIVETLSRRFIPGTLRHAGRRAGEMAQVSETCRAAGWDPVMSVGAERFLQRVADLELEQPPAGEDFRQGIQRLLRAVQGQEEEHDAAGA